jgi:hypothetical protein
VRRCANAPRVLNDPAYWRYSSFSVNGKSTRPKSAPDVCNTGVRRIRGLTTSYIRAISSRPTGDIYSLTIISSNGKLAK